MANISKRQYFYFVSLMLMITTYLPVLYNNLPPIMRSHHIWTGLWIVSIILFYPKIFNDKLIRFVLFYGFIFVFILQLTLWEKVDEWNKNLIINEFYQIFIGLTLITYFRQEKDYYRLSKLVKWVLIFVFITSILTIITTYIVPNYIRDLTGLQGLRFQNQITSTLEYKSYGAGNYSFIASILCLLPIMTYYLKNKDIKQLTKRLFLFYIIVIFYTLISAQLFANLLLAAFVILFSILGSQNRKKAFFLSFVVLFLFLLIPIDFYSNFLLEISNFFPVQSDTYAKLKDLSNYLILGKYNIYGTSGIAARLDRYPLLFDSFVLSPIYGHFAGGLTNDIAPGAHLYWMNKLTVYGIFGFIPFTYIIYRFLKTSNQYIDKRFIYFYYLALGSIIVLGFMKILTGREMWYMFFFIVGGLDHFPNILLNKKINKPTDNHTSKLDN